MKNFTIKNLTIGSGLPKICVPIVATTREEILNSLETYNRKEIDLLEWRIDYMKNIQDIPALISIAKEITATLPNKPLLVTFRSKQEGGEQELSISEYLALNQEFANQKAADLVDIELFCTQDTELLASTVSKIKATGTKVIFSNHDFFKTPSKSTIIDRLKNMQELGGDIAKIAVMPTCTEDVLTLLSATRQMSEEFAQIPIVTMSMGQLGTISRICGSTFGSAITFGALEQASAPGQIPVEKLYDTLHTLGTK